MASASNTFPMQEQSGSTISSDSERKRRNQRDRARHASETVAQKEERLRKRRVRDRPKRAAETEDQRAARLARLSANQSERLSVETEDQRTTRLARLSANQSERLLKRQSSTSHSYSILHTLRLAPNHVLHVTSITNKVFNHLITVN